ncbi:MAG: sigma-70 family RNA polymerase sigma factor [Clostridia bacterium]|nr:sigma-70 family RNA polymerase sigma factor [Clostridia bacterium]
MTEEAAMQRLTEEFLPAFLGFSIQKIGNIKEAEELSQEIAYQCVIAIRKGNIGENFEAYLWTIAHNTFRKWCIRKECRPVSLDDECNSLSNIPSYDPPVEERLIREEETAALRKALSRLSRDYRNALVCYYYDELSIADTGKKLGLSEGMVKFYLRAGKQKLKEAYIMKEIGEKSFRPSEFTVYKSSIDISKVNVWEVFKRMLPCQLALVCNSAPKTISDISLETGVPALYVEEEIDLLVNAGVMISPVKGKYRTNLHILRKNAVAQVKEQFAKLYETYIPVVLETYERTLPRLKECDVYKFEATEQQWAWFFAALVEEFDYKDNWLTEQDYPQILSCGSKGFIFAEEAKGSRWGMGVTPVRLDECTVLPVDVLAFGDFHRQSELWWQRPEKSQALYNVYCGRIREKDAELYAELIREGYIIRKDGQLLCNVAVHNSASRAVMEEVNRTLREALQEMCKPIREGIHRIVKATIPPQLTEYARGFAETWISFYAGVYLKEALYNAGFLSIPEAGDVTPVACRIDVK